MKTASFHAWNLADFIKSGEFHEIHWISCTQQNLPDFMTMKSGRFHEIWWISPTTPLSLNAKHSVDFMKSTGFDAKWAKDPWSYFICSQSICQSNQNQSSVIPYLTTKNKERSVGCLYRYCACIDTQHSSPYYYFLAQITNIWWCIWQYIGQLI